MKKSDVKIKKSSGNVFRDLGLPDADRHMVKAGLVLRIQETIRDRNITQAAAAEIMGVSQPEVSRMLRGQFREMSVERLMSLLTRLGCKVDIVVQRPNKRKFAPIHVET